MTHPHNPGLQPRLQVSRFLPVEFYLADLFWLLGNIDRAKSEAQKIFPIAAFHDAFVSASDVSRQFAPAHRLLQDKIGNELPAMMEDKFGWPRGVFWSGDGRHHWTHYSLHAHADLCAAYVHFDRTPLLAPVLADLSTQAAVVGQWASKRYGAVGLRVAAQV